MEGRQIPLHSFFTSISIFIMVSREGKLLVNRVCMRACVCAYVRVWLRPACQAQAFRGQWASSTTYYRRKLVSINPAVPWVEYPAFWPCSSSAWTGCVWGKYYKDCTSFHWKKLVELHFPVCKARACLPPLKRNVVVNFFLNKDKRPIQMC